MRIAIIKSNVSHPGGLEKQALRIAQAFANHGLDVLWIAPKIPYSFFKPGFIKLEQFDRKATEQIKQEKPDIIFGMDRTQYATHLRAGNGVHAAFLETRKKYEGIFKYWRCKINPLHRTILELEKKAFESPGLKTLFVNSHMVKAEACLHYKIDPQKIEVIHNGVEWDEMEIPFHASFLEKTTLLNQFHLPLDKIHLLFAGSGYHRKGLDLVLLALSLSKLPYLHLSVVGKDKNISKYQALAKQLKIDSQVSFFGFKPSLTPFYQYSDILCIPSFYDPFANVTIEALAMGLFVMSSKQNGGHEILTPEIGYTTPHNTVDAWIEALHLATFHSKIKSKAICIRNAVSHLSFSNQLQKLVEITCKR